MTDAKDETKKVTTVLEFHKKLVMIQQTLKAPKGQYNDFGKYKYRSCEDILEAIKPLLADHALRINLNDEVILLGERFYIKATVTVTDGVESISTTAFARETDIKSGMDASQITGAASSYARKYALNGLFAIDDEKDADTRDNRENKPASTQTSEKKTWTPKPASDAQKKMIFALFADLGMEAEEAKEQYKNYFKLDSFSNLNMTQATKIIDHLKKKLDAKIADEQNQDQGQSEEIDLDEVDKAIS